MEKYFHLIHFACLISSLLWNVKGAYYLKPTGRFEITEIPLPSSVIEQINKNTASVTPNPSRINATGVQIVTAVTRISNTSQVPKPAASQQPCPTTPTCSCPCPKPSLSSNPLSLRPLPSQNNNTWCTSVCICLCIGGAPVPIQPPTAESKGKAALTTPNLKVTSPMSNRSTTAVPSSTPTISKMSRSVSNVCPETAGQSRPSATLSPTITESMLPFQKGPAEN
ncbi:uncharacterized protein LOC111334650 isoform X2 [Stylophora pistillata]|uniref:uncharacterized protein LOC111334650 isoform X2 n=1 Tax=Stylophora pistillata TaxID=50429 RepID=UPI000C045F79|nr:uncharacterized protein LOC111334650 isoform X2 [Stylophora pistillata]